MSWFAIFLILAAYWFFRSPVSGAVAEAIRHRHGGGTVGGGPAGQEALDALRRDVRELRDEVMELGERLDITERMLADVRRRMVLPGAGS